MEKMTVRCFGHSNGPIEKFIDFIKKNPEISSTLEVYMVEVDAKTAIEMRGKRPMATVDMEPRMRDKITQVVIGFFHPGTSRSM